MKQFSSPLLFQIVQALALMLIMSLLTAPLSTRAASTQRVRLLTTHSYANSPLNPPGPVDASTAATTFTVPAADFPVDAIVSNVTIDITFAKVGDGSCPGPGGGDDWAEEIRFILTAPDGTLVRLVRYNDYNFSDPDVGQVTVTFDDDAATSVAGLPIQSGTFRPSSGAMADFIGLEPATNGGVWTLELSDQWVDDPLCFTSATLHITAINPPDLSIEKTDGPDPAIAGEDLFYTITVRNNGLDAAADVLITDTLPGAVTYLDDSGGCTFVPGAGPGGADQLLCSLADIAPDAARSVQIRTRVSPDVVAAESDGTLTIFNRAAVSTTDPELYLANNTVVEGTFIQDQADLRVTKLSPPATSVQAGELFTYTIYVDNLGLSYARSVTVIDEILSSGAFQLVNLIDDPNRTDHCSPAATGNGFNIACSLAAPLETGGRWAIRLALQADEAQNVDNLVEVYSATPDQFLSNNQAVDFVSIAAVADLDISKTAVGQTQQDGQPGGVFTATVDAVTAGGALTYTLIVRNHGPSTAENVVVRDHFPVSTTVVDVAASQGQCNQGTPGNPAAPQLCNLGILPPGHTATMTISLDVQTSLPTGTLLYNEAMVSSDTFDPDNTNDLTTNHSNASAWADLRLTKTQEPAMVLPDDSISYTITVENLGPSDAPETLISQILPNGINDVTWRCVPTGGAICAASGSGQLEEFVHDLPAGGAIAYTVHGTLHTAQIITSTTSVTAVAGYNDPWDANNIGYAINTPSWTIRTIYLPVCVKDSIP